MQPTQGNFGRVTVLIHWLVAIFTAITVICGLTTTYADSTELTRSSLFLHQTIGFSIFLIMIFRTIWRLTHAAPPLPSDMPRNQKAAAVATHILLYVAMFTLIATGYTELAARGRDITIAGLFDLPLIVPLNRPLSVASQSLHSYLQYVLYALLALHIGAALYHQLILKDSLLRRMWFK
jgi:cytochrome b561